MRLRLEVKEEDQQGAAGAGAHAAQSWTSWPWRRTDIDEGDTQWEAPQLLLQTGPLRLIDGDPAEVLRELLIHEKPQGVEVVLVADEQGESAHGWPLRLCHAALARDGQVIEHRLCAFYRFFDHGGVALLRVRDVGLFAAQKAVLVELLRSGRPDWSGEDAPDLHSLFV
jgi:hypothetical protein